jgi:succinate dehydrogenase/fumarate reductase cytochrome b subunit
VAFARLPIIQLGEILLIAAVVLHGLNGLRITLLALGIALRYQKSIFAVSFLITVLVAGIFAVRLFGS